MTKYRVIFQYGTWKLWADIESPEIAVSDRRGFADIAQNAVNNTLDAFPQIERGHVAHDYSILRITYDMDGNKSSQLVYAFDTLSNE